MSEVLGESLRPEVAAPVDAPPVGARWAAVTCDVEPDYGNRTQSSDLIADPKYLDTLVAHCTSLGVPLSAFVVTQCLSSHPSLTRALVEHDLDVHAHSHRHDTQRYATSSVEEIAACQECFRSHFGRPAMGYRAPQGLVVPGDSAAMADREFVFDASVFPSRRRGLFDYRRLPREPWRWKSGVVELPFASAGRGRAMLTVSYLKLFGKLYWRSVLKPDILPRVLVIDSHLHDFFKAPTFGQLPLAFRLAYSRNRRNGLALLGWLIGVLRGFGYEFLTMSELYRRVAVS